MIRFFHDLAAIGRKTGHVAKVIGKDAVKFIDRASPLTDLYFPELAIAEPLVASLISLIGGHMQGDTPNVTAAAPAPGGATIQLSALEMLGITLILGVLNTVVKNPTHKAALQSHLLNLADDIYITYGMMPSARP